MIQRKAKFSGALFNQLEVTENCLCVSAQGPIIKVENAQVTELMDSEANKQGIPLLYPPPLDGSVC